MDKLINIDEARKNEIVSGAISKETPCVVTRRSVRGWQPCKTRFVCAPDSAGRVLVSADDDSELRDGEPMIDGERVGLTFRRGHKKCMCSTLVIGHGVDMTTADGSRQPCVELQWPQELQELQRRVYHRAAPAGRRVHVRFWPGGVAGRATAESTDKGLYMGAMLDLSAGGIRVLTVDVAPDTFAEGDTLGCAFSPKPRSEPLVLDATFRHFELLEDGSAALGLQFVGLETSERGKALLAKLAGIVSDYQRGHARRERQKLAGRFARS